MRKRAPSERKFVRKFSMTYYIISLPWCALKTGQRPGLIAPVFAACPLVLHRPEQGHYLHQSHPRREGPEPKTTPG